MKWAVYAMVPKGCKSGGLVLKSANQRPVPRVHAYSFFGPADGAPPAISVSTAGSTAAAASSASAATTSASARRGAPQWDRLFERTQLGHMP